MSSTRRFPARIAVNVGSELSAELERRAIAEQTTVSTLVRRLLYREFTPHSEEKRDPDTPEPRGS